ncbi:MAG TPA: hypothetical protein VNG35_04135 [Gemmatimonadales bacterium]|nr:hypothetical protein [Gemmatimonadales bacterium]
MTNAPTVRPVTRRQQGEPPAVEVKFDDIASQQDAQHVGDAVRAGSDALQRAERRGVFLRVLPRERSRTRQQESDRAE